MLGRLQMPAAVWAQATAWCPGEWEDAGEDADVEGQIWWQFERSASFQMEVRKDKKLHVGGRYGRYLLSDRFGSGLALTHCIQH